MKLKARRKSAEAATPRPAFTTALRPHYDRSSDIEGSSNRGGASSTLYDGARVHI
jgi:hypothetical protein